MNHGLVLDAGKPRLVGPAVGVVALLLLALHDAALVPFRPLRLGLGDRGAPALGLQDAVQLARYLLAADAAVVHQVVQRDAPRLGGPLGRVHERQGLVLAHVLRVDAVAVEPGRRARHAETLVDALVLPALVAVLAGVVGPHHVGEPALELLQEGHDGGDERDGAVEQVVQVQPPPAHDDVGGLRHRHPLLVGGVVPVAHLLEHAPELCRGDAVEVDREGVQEPRVGRLVVPAVPGHRGHVDGGVLGDRRLHEGGDALQVVGDGEPLYDGHVDLLALDELLAGLGAELQGDGVGLAVELAALAVIAPPLLKEPIGKDIPVESQWIAPLPTGLVEHAAAHGDVSLSFALPIGPLLLFCEPLFSHPQSPSPRVFYTGRIL